jgi:hypothetical protein
MQWSTKNQFEVASLLRKLADAVKNGRITDGKQLLAMIEDGLPIETEENEEEPYPTGWFW